MDRETNFAHPLGTLYTAPEIVKSVVFGWVWYKFYTMRYLLTAVLTLTSEPIFKEFISDL